MLCQCRRCKSLLKSEAWKAPLSSRALKRNTILLDYDHTIEHSIDHVEPNSEDTSHESAIAIALIRKSGQAGI